MIEIKMDEAGYEVYYSLDEAVKAFTHNIALENATLDLDIGLLLESDVDPFSNYGMEAIAEKVKEMASKAKSNFVLYAKKFINFFFGWLIRFFQGVVQIKKSMKSNYAKAQKYLKALNKYEMQARRSSEKTLEITNASNIVSYGLTMTQIIKQTIKMMTVSINDQSQGIKDLDQDKSNDEFNKGLNKIEAATTIALDIVGIINKLPLNNGGKLENILAKYDYNIVRMMESLGKSNNGSNNSESNGNNTSNDFEEDESNESSESFNGSRESSRGSNGNSGNSNNNGNRANSGASSKNNGGKKDANNNDAKSNNKKDEPLEGEVDFGDTRSLTPSRRSNNRKFDDVIEAEVVDDNETSNKTNTRSLSGRNRRQISMMSYEIAFESNSKDEINKASAHIKNIDRFLNSPERRELKCPDAWDYLRSQLILFINIAKNNKWDFENDVKKVELARRDLIKTLDGLNVEKKTDDVVKAYLKNVVDAGNSISKLQNAANSAIRNVNKALDMMMTDVTKLGSVLVTVTGEPAKDKE